MPDQAQEVYSKQFDSIFFKLDSSVRSQIEFKIGEMGMRLSKFPHHRLKGGMDYRLRMGDYRVIYQFDLNQNVIHLLAVGHRREIYR